MEAAGLRVLDLSIDSFFPEIKLCKIGKIGTNFQKKNLKHKN
jgi:hypothetical protein